ncbi:MAG: type II toxin-antitoxin system RelE/ParE family toxin [Planctomycetaceae bacterium]|nr:type II toxin-antitoxin system RelE/ParE family toxin [Planctomycetaceae bacterium]
MSYQVVILSKAEEELQQILNWIKDRSQEGAKSWLVAFQQATELLKHDPLARSKAPEDEFMDWEIRQFLFKTPRGRSYRALFTVVDREIRILHVRGPGQADVSPDEISRDE